MRIRPRGGLGRFGLMGSLVCAILAGVLVFSSVFEVFRAEPARALTSVSYDYGGSGSITIPNYVVSLTVTVWGGGGGGAGAVACIEDSYGGGNPQGA
ncbi:MAG: hypothetical protein LBL08_01510, partial [Candidatus Nomurabacteria bacterium]|nr:hypothetical protein [Candidatus Nomurabacteria bacterium]